MTLKFILETDRGNMNILSEFERDISSNEKIIAVKDHGKSYIFSRPPSFRNRLLRIKIILGEDMLILSS